MAKKKQPSVEADQKVLIAKRDWRIISGSWDRKTGKQEIDFQIVAGDDVSTLPAWALTVLKTENVI